MIIYLDTSALVKKYVKEDGTEDVIRHWQNAEFVVTSAVAYAEAMAAFFRKMRETNMNRARLDELISVFSDDWEGLVIVEVTRELNDIIIGLLEKHHLRGFDAIHLASAVLIQNALDQDLHFMCYDQNLQDAAYTEGLKTFPYGLKGSDSIL